MLTGLDLVGDSELVPTILHQRVTSLGWRLHQAELCLYIGRLLVIAQVMPCFALVQLSTGPRCGGVRLPGPQRRGKRQR